MTLENEMIPAGDADAVDAYYIVPVSVTVDMVMWRLVEVVGCNMRLDHTLLVVDAAVGDMHLHVADMMVDDVVQ
jgi:hypothetical protein